MADMKRVDLSAKRIQEPVRVKKKKKKIVRPDPPRHIDINIGIHHLDHRAPEPPNPCGTDWVVEFAGTLTRDDIVAIADFGGKLKNNKLTIPQERVNDAVKFLSNERIISLIKK